MPGMRTKNFCLSLPAQFPLSFTGYSLTLPTDKSGGFLVRRPLRRILGLGVLHDLPKREFPCAPRYFCYARLPWLCSPRLAAGYSLPRYGRGRDALRTAGTSIRGRRGSSPRCFDSRRRCTSGSTDRRSRPLIARRRAAPSYMQAGGRTLTSSHPRLPAQACGS